MSCTRNGTELSALIIDEFYGELSCRIFTLLLRRGRLSFPALAHYSRLTPRQLRHGLVVLIQQNLIYHHKDRETRLTYYEAKKDAAYWLLRTGKIMEITESRFGTVARDIVQNLLLLGNTKIADLVEAYNSRWNTKEAQVNGDAGDANCSLTKELHNGTNGDSDGGKLSNLDEVLCRLLEAELIEPVVESMFMSPSDTYQKVEQEVLQSHFGGSTKGTKQKDDLKAKVIDKLRALRQERKVWGNKGNKRSANGVHTSNPQKRQKLSNGNSLGSNRINGYQDDSPSLNRDLVVRVNYDKCAVLLRNQRLISLAAHDIGETTSQVYAELLSQLEDKIPRCRQDPIIDAADDETEGPTVTTLEICRALNNSIDPAIGIGKVSNDKVDTSFLERPRKKRNISALGSNIEGLASSDEDDIDDVAHVADLTNEVEQDSSDHSEDPDDGLAAKEPSRQPKVTFKDTYTKPVLEGDGQSKMVHVKRHLLLLMEHPRRFVRLCGSRGLGEWTVDFSGLVEYLKEIELDTIISQRFGIIGKRIAQILRHKGKLDEKQIQKFGLLKQKDVRTKLVELQMVGFVDIQEVPRDNNRTPSRTMFLWFLDINRIVEILQDSIYKAMSRCFQVLEIERVGVAAILERTDIKGREEELLDRNEFKEFCVIRAKEEKILTQVSRLDDLVAIFRDF